MDGWMDDLPYDDAIREDYHHFVHVLLHVLMIFMM
jgi:hypothetical protein